MLGLAENKVGIHDDFFKLGGDSILAIRLVIKLNHYYQSHLKVSDIFVYRNIELLSSRIIQTKDGYQPIVKLNNIYKKPYMFMIHPGAAGCEVYTSLANKLANHFNCYGVDSYNLYHEKKIDNLNELAKYYLSYINEIMINAHNQVYHLFSWSLGGQISLEIAYIDIEEIKNEYKNYAISEGIDKSYITKIMTNIDIDDKIEKHKISSTLNNTHVLLFKAMLEDTRFKANNFKKVHEYSSTLEYNNIDKILKNKSNIKLIKVNKADHGNILDQEELIVSEIISWS
ncbi:MAG: hypothetical protein EBY20_05295 [Alphaproteobacteria bacterium]|nr:hypothetical protein [Alphaproteobacteria bacterium]